MNISNSELQLILTLIEEKIEEVDFKIEDYYFSNNHEGFLAPYNEYICTPYDELQTKLYSLMDKIRRELMNHGN